MPYLTMLLFSKSSAAVWLAGERERALHEGGDEMVRAISGQEEIQRQGDEESD